MDDEEKSTKLNTYTYFELKALIRGFASLKLQNTIHLINLRRLDDTTSCLIKKKNIEITYIFKRYLILLGPIR